MSTALINRLATMTGTTRQATQAFLRQTAAAGLAALVTLSVLGSIDRLAVTPTPDSLLATAKTPQARS